MFADSITPGHQQSVNFVAFSPDGRLIVSTSFDKSAKIWDGRTGKYVSHVWLEPLSSNIDCMAMVRFLGSLRGHVGPVYRATWAGDSRMLVTASEDSTMKLWDVKVLRPPCL